jgi:hypothetical protein
MTVRVLPIAITIITRMASIGLFIGTSLLRVKFPISPRRGQVDRILELIAAVFAGPYVSHTAVGQMLRPLCGYDIRTALRTRPVQSCAE